MGFAWCGILYRRFFYGKETTTENCVLYFVWTFGLDWRITGTSFSRMFDKVF